MSNIEYNVWTSDVQSDDENFKKIDIKLKKNKQNNKLKKDIVHEYIVRNKISNYIDNDSIIPIYQHFQSSYFERIDK